MYRQYFGFIFFFQLQILALQVLHYQLSLHPPKYGLEEYIEFTFPFNNSNLYVRVSLTHSQFIIEKRKDNDFNITDINILTDDIDEKKKKSGKLAIGKFKINSVENVTLNFIYSNSSTYSYLGLAREVDYNNKEVEKNYDMDFISQLIKNNVIQKYFIYFSPFYYNNGSFFPEPYLELGRLPDPFIAYSKLSSYSPLNKKYTKKWSIHLSHVLFGDFNPKNIPEENQKAIHAEVIFTESLSNNNLIPYDYKIYFDDIFINKLNCEASLSNYKCPNKMIESFKFYFVFNGFAHLIPNSILFYTVSDLNYTSFKFTKEIDYISLDSNFFGFYHRLYDKENNTIRFVYPQDKNYILDVQSLGYENRDGVKKDYKDIIYLQKWESELIEKEKNINITYNEIEEKKKELNKKEGELNELNKNLSIWEKNLKEKEKETEEKIKNFENKIKELNNNIDSLEKKNLNLSKNISEKEEQIKMFESKIKDLNYNISNLNKIISEKDKEIKEKNNNNSFKITLIVIIILIIIIIIIICYFSYKLKKEKIEHENIVSLINE